MDARWNRTLCSVANDQNGRDLRLREVELMGRYSNPDNVAKLQHILAGQERDRPPARTTRSPHQIHHRLTTDDVKRLIDLYNQGELIDDLATQFHISRTTVMKHVERAGAPRRRNLLTRRLEEAQQLYDQGWSLARIGQHLGVNASTVWRTFRNADMPMRDPHGR
jgi:DNA-binding NarL/FixJ family response regulator